MGAARRSASTLAIAFALAFITTAAGITEERRPLRDGRQFDPGTLMAQRAAGAPEQLDQLRDWLGGWDVQYATHDDSGHVHVAHGRAVITLMNRGHAFMERFHSEDFDGNGNALSTLAFVVYNPTGDVWGLGEANSFTEHITVHTGKTGADGLELYDAVRRRGGPSITHSRLRLRVVDAGHFELRREEALDRLNSWKTKVVKTYTRSAAPAAIFSATSNYGTPAPGVPPEARQFDFLLGEWSMQHDMTFPNGQQVSFPVSGTGVHALDGHAIMEFNWYDVDPQLPDAATTIVRLYNRQTRSWECMYLTNRFNNLLHFGGVREGDKIVLHQFNADASDAPISYWTFHDMKPDAYGWYANTSRDRGATFQKTWIIAATRKAPVDP